MDTHQAEETTVSLENKCASWLKSALSAGDSNLEKDELRKDAKQVFCSIAASASLAADIREASLAKLLKYLGPGLTEKLTSRICSLSIILGAIEGLQGAELSLGTANLLASFFLEQCAPLDDHSVNFGEDYVEQIRDLSLGCLSNLMKCKLGTTANPTESISAIKLLCTTSRQAVERRCALSDDDEDYQSFGLTGMGAMAGGLSNLPRSRRSLCFELLQSAVDGVDRIVAESSDLQHSGLPSRLATELPSFVTFVCSCLQGESDPRCLMQLLVLFRKIQVAFESIFKAGKLSSFPITTMFDAVAPYYPINFTPPPHDNHGITQMGLKDALMSVLSGFGYDGLATRRGDTMVNLSVGIVLERLVPLEGGDDTNLASSTDEKQEAVDDISLLLFSHGESMVDGLVKESVSLLSKALVCTHHEAAIAVSRGGSCKKENKLVADTCRSLVAKIAFQVEGNKSLWNIFVRDAVVGMATKLDSNSMEGRTAVAYLASLATSGAPQTLRFVLDKSLEKCIRKMKESMNDEESLTLAAYGIGAFFSACNVAVERAKKRGVLFHPHPTEKFCSSALLVLSEILLDKEKSEPLKTAALIALESLLGACPSEYFDESQKETLCQVLTDMAAGIAEATEAADFSQDYIMASAKTLGALIGGAFVPVDEEEPLSNKVVVSQQIQDLLKAKLMANLLSRSTQFVSNRTQQRYDRIALARACSSNDTAAASILEALLSSLKQSMKLHSLGDQSVEHLMAINAVIRESGPGAQRAFHSSQTVFDIIDKLCSLDPRITGDENKAMDMTALNLPPTETELVGAMRKTQEVVTLLLPAYQTCLPQEVFLSYLSMISKVLPPLSSEDTTRLSIVLPLLSAALEKGTLPLPDDPSFHSAADLFASIGCDLANYAIGSEYEARSRTGAAACLHAYITNFWRDTNVCPAQQLLKDVAIPNLLLAYDNLRNAPKGKLNEEHFVDCLNLCMNLVSYQCLIASSTSALSESTHISFFPALSLSYNTTRVLQLHAEVACLLPPRMRWLHFLFCFLATARRSCLLAPRETIVKWIFLHLAEAVKILPIYP